jgi:VIT1/CCC1 family predicted Fe2+/Mn2+ transporter
MHDGTEDRVWRGKKTQGSQLHQAAMPAWQAQEHASRTLFSGMLLILGAFLLYVVYVVRMEELEGRKTAWRRFVRWFERKLDVPIRHRG